MDIQQWFDELTDRASLRDAAQKADTAKSTLSRQLDRGSFPPEMVIALCRAYGRSPVTGLIETGYIEPWETDGVSIPFALEQATNRQILDEIMRRSDPEARHLFGADEDTIGLADDAEVFDFPTPHVAPLAYVADSSPDEPEMGDDGYHDGP